MVCAGRGRCPNGREERRRRRSSSASGCFWAHLAVEKALKSWLIHLSLPFPKIHDLVALYNLLPVEQRDIVALDDLNVLNPWSLAGRYPDDLMEASQEEAHTVVQAARRVVDKIGEQVA